MSKVIELKIGQPVAKDLIPEVTARLARNDWSFYDWCFGVEPEAGMFARFPDMKATVTKAGKLVFTCRKQAEANKALKALADWEWGMVMLPPIPAKKKAAAKKTAAKKAPAKKAPAKKVATKKAAAKVPAKKVSAKVATKKKAAPAKKVATKAPAKKVAPRTRK